MPGSPTPFEMGLRGIVSATQNANAALGGGFASPRLAPAMAGGGGGGAVIVNFTYQTTFSPIDSYRFEQEIKPMITRLINEAKRG
jgi:hypothetical protein